ncbi:DNA double-strand break repair nuclease NurA [Dyella lutea]|uniref:DNA double-strand break repair nuclease NurA n=1 Tax=Dyella lutea TaxID=2950441 RepID=A0ABT1FBD6_9GAMM|nr:DNA double-strand break repair nuclease NurA [Dyella lutea]MCP1374684.1 DNA double-strand break repair nuclease NurA [Dyella lutea]
MTNLDIRHRIEARISQGEFLANMLLLVHKDSGNVQADFVERLCSIATTVRALLEGNGLLQKILYQPSTYWPEQRGKSYAFVDGGVASVDLPSAGPIGIRVGSYLVRPGDESDSRERFKIELSLVDDLYSPNGALYDDDFLDLAKLRDAARIVSELSAGLSLARQVDGDGPPDAVVLHGPLVNPVAPYGLDGFPPFGLGACRQFVGDNDWHGDDRDRQFVSLYALLLEKLRETGTPVVGAVERSVGRDPIFIRTALDGLLKAREAETLLEQIRSYGLNDAALLDVVLVEGEYVTPLAVGRQGARNKWPRFWEEKIGRYPKALTTYLKPSALVQPFRVEAFEDVRNLDSVLALILHTSRLLPSYGFPVGLDIVDKFAKVPAWLSRGVKGQHQVVLLKQALASGDPRAVSFAKRVVAAKGRDWLFRPEA